MNPPAARLRPARLTDAAAIARVHVETWRATYAGLVPDAYLVGMTEAGQTASWQRQLDQRQGRGPDRSPARDLVVEASGGRLVGFGACGPRRVGELPYKGEVYALYVAIDWQGRGLGRRLLGGLFAALLDGGVSSAYLWVLAGNPSRYFYEAMGGERIAERKENFAGTRLDEVAYAWPDLAAWLACR